jgi:FkbM family methyltransferase
MGMGILSALERGFERLFPRYRIRFAPEMAALLQESPVKIVDIGGAMGPDQRWLALRPNRAHFMTFEPDSRSLDGLLANDAGDVTFPVALGGVSGTRTLTLTEGEFASSLYPPNESVLADFSVWPWYHTTGSTEVEVTTLDLAVAKVPGWRTDFIKVDIEGADLEVLQAGTQALSEAFGVQIEMSVIQRNLGTPLQPEAAAWLESQGFVPWLLLREHWARAGRLHGLNTAHQLAWADAVYFRDRTWVLRRLAEAASTADAEALLGRIIAILIAYEAHDYADELVAHALKAQLIGGNIATSLLASVQKSIWPMISFVTRGTLATCLSLAIAVIGLVMPSRMRGALAGLFKSQARNLTRHMLSQFSHGGLDNGCVSD